MNYGCRGALRLFQRMQRIASSSSAISSKAASVRCSVVSRLRPRCLAVVTSSTNGEGKDINRSCLMMFSGSPDVWRLKAGRWTRILPEAA